MKPILIYLTALLCLVTIGCKKKAVQTNTAVQQVSTRTASAEGFVPPADSTVTPAQMTCWLSCNPVLDSLSILYKDSLSAPNTATRSIAQENFRRMQNRICVRMGFAGGYAEYAWVIDAIKAPVNSALRDSFRISTFSAQ